jgi:hypothetical protein
MHRRITYANVAATLALVFSMTGSAIAAKHYLINSTNQISPKVLKKLKTPGPAGPMGPKGATGATGASGATGAGGATGAPGSALAYAHVSALGVLDAAASKNLSAGNVSHPGAGVYCFSGLSFTPHNATADLDWTSTANGIIESISVTVGEGAKSLCGSESAEIGVLTGEVKPGTFTAGLNRAFYITIN